MPREQQDDSARLFVVFRWWGFIGQSNVDGVVRTLAGPGLINECNALPSAAGALEKLLPPPAPSSLVVWAVRSPNTSDHGVFRTWADANDHRFNHHVGSGNAVKFTGVDAAAQAEE